MLRRDHASDSDVYCHDTHKQERRATKQRRVEAQLSRKIDYFKKIHSRMRK